MARPVECMAWLDPAIVDGELVEFFVAVCATRRDRTRLRSRPARCAAHWISCERSRPPEENSLGNGFASRRLHSRNDSHRRCFPLEFPLAAPTPSRPRTLCRRSTRILFAKTKTSRRLLHAPARNHAHNRGLCFANSRRASLPPGLDFSRPRPWVADGRVAPT